MSLLARLETILKSDEQWVEAHVEAALADIESHLGIDHAAPTAETPATVETTEPTTAAAEPATPETPAA